MSKYDYDVIIIGAGISGLVCGCYLAKAGIKTLILEKNAKPGGYCTSFTRKGYNFDACVHSLGSLREGGNIRMILQELDLENRLKITRYDPSDIIVTPDFKLHFWNDLNKTIKEFQGVFPQEKENIEIFFKYINKCEGLSLGSLRSITFEELLNKYFKDNKLKNVLSFPLLGNAGLSGKRISALTGVLIYKEFMFDGGYYPDGSIQALADVFVDRFKEFGGEIFFASPVSRIELDNKKVVGIETKKRDFISSKYVISNADATQTFISLIGKEFMSKEMTSVLESMEPSLSMFILYLGLKDSFRSNITVLPNTNIWYLPDYDINKMYNLAVEGDIDNVDCFLLRVLSDSRSALMLVFAPFNNSDYWKDNKERLIDLFVEKIDRAVPGFSSNVVYKDAATPNTLYKWTLNHEGASYGWAGTPSQLAVSGFTQKTDFENLFLTGHWTTLVQGVGGVAYLGRETSRKIIKRTNL